MQPTNGNGFCQICCKEFDDSDKPFAVLACGHTAHEKCLSGRRSQEEVCPFCCGRSFILNKRLTYAAMKGNVDDVTTLLADPNVNVDERSSNGLTPLLCALMLEHDEIAKLLIERGANVCANSEDKYSPLTWAVSHGNLALAELLIRKGASARAKDKNGWSALDWARAHGKINIINMLVERGAEVSDDILDDVDQDDDAEAFEILLSHLKSKRVALNYSAHVRNGRRRRYRCRMRRKKRGGGTDTNIVRECDNR